MSEVKATSFTPAASDITSTFNSSAHLPIDLLLIDLDGTLYVDNVAIPGAIQTLDTLRQQGYTLRFLTNTTTKTRQQIAQHVQHLGFDISEDEIVTAPEAARQFLRQQAQTGKSIKVWPVVAQNVIPEFAEFENTSESPDYIVVGDIGEQWNYELLNRIFNQLLNGAKLLALHKNRYWHTANALHVDIGLFIHGLEYVTGQPAMVMGKPSEDYFQSTLTSVGRKPAQTLIVGDDIESDIGGGQAAGLTGVLVKTGKYRTDIVATSQVKPDVQLNSITELPAWLSQ